MNYAHQHNLNLLVQQESSAWTMHFTTSKKFRVDNALSSIRCLIDFAPALGRFVKLWELPPVFHCYLAHQQCVKQKQCDNATYIATTWKIMQCLVLLFLWFAPRKQCVYATYLAHAQDCCFYGAHLAWVKPTTLQGLVHGLYTHKNKHKHSIDTRIGR